MADQLALPLDRAVPLITNPLASADPALAAITVPPPTRLSTITVCPSALPQITRRGASISPSSIAMTSP